GFRDFLRGCSRWLVPGFQNAEEPRDFTFHIVGHPDRGSLGNRLVSDCRRLQLRGADALAGDVERVVRAAVQEPVAVLVDGSPVAVGPDTGKATPVRLEVPLVVVPDP